MTFIRLVLADAGPARLALIAATVLSGVCMGVMLIVVNSVIDDVQPQSPHVTLIALFIGACAGFIVAKSYALNLVTFVVENLVGRWRVRLIGRMREMDLASFERVGEDRIALVLTRELQLLSSAGTTLVHASTTTVMLIMTSLYVARLSLLAFLAIVLALGAAVQLYRLTQVRTRFLLDQSIAADDAFSTSFNHMLNGFREVKLSAHRSDDLFLNHVKSSSERVSHFKIEAGRRMALGDNVINAVFYLLVGYIVFILPQTVGSSQTASKLINVILFSVSAVELVVRGLPMLDRSAVAIDTLDALEKEIQAGSAGEERRASDAVQPFSSIQAHHLMYSYRSREGDRSFVVGPINLEVRRGEVLFIVGGNGSGKSTLLTLLTRLYDPEQGFILWDGIPVDPSNVRDYRHLFSAIFSDFHLFDRLYGLNNVDDKAAGALIEELQMADKVRVEQGRFSTLELSTGQRKRLAMVVARLEDRPIMVFDEWAADQDPSFRHFFYDTLIPTLQASGKTVIAVTHDDRFFSVADRVLVMDRGKLEEAGLPVRT